VLASLALSLENHQENPIAKILVTVHSPQHDLLTAAKTATLQPITVVKIQPNLTAKQTPLTPITRLPDNSAKSTPYSNRNSQNKSNSSKTKPEPSSQSIRNGSERRPRMSVIGCI
jgi:hypothetical protein